MAGAGLGWSQVYRWADCAGELASQAAGSGFDVPEQLGFFGGFGFSRDDAGQIIATENTSFHPKWWFSTGNPLISGKPRLVKYYNLAR